MADKVIDPTRGRGRQANEADDANKAKANEADKANKPTDEAENQ